MGLYIRSQPRLFLYKEALQAMKGLGKNVQNIKLAKADPQLAASSQCFMTTTQVSVQIGKVRKALGSIALAMSKGAQMVRSHCRCLPFDGCVLPGKRGAGKDRVS